MESTPTKTSFDLPGLTGFYQGKVRDVYFLENNRLLMIASDRISAFDVILPKPIPHKGKVLAGIATHFLKATSSVVPNWLIDNPLPGVSYGHAAEPFKVEMVIRGYLSGHAWRTYQSGLRTLCGETLAEGLRENDKLPQPIITPTTKAPQGEHDEDISKAEILARGIVSPEDYDVLEDYTHKLFALGTQMAAERGLILVDTKYEFGKTADGQIILIDEVHTPDSSRYFYADGYEQRQNNGEAQQQLSKEFVRQWLIANGFQGKQGQQVPEMTEQVVKDISEKYLMLYELITGKPMPEADLKIWDNASLQSELSHWLLANQGL